jgi:hypothetical protein
VRERLEVNVFAPELQRAIPNEYTRQQARFTQNLKAVAETKHQTVIRGEFLDSLHDWTESCDRARAQIIPIAEPTRNDYRIRVAE